jgi:transposase-like protein
MLTQQNGAAKADPEVLAKPQRRRFPTEYKLRVLRQYEATPKGERGAFLRREGLYSSHIDTWRKLAASGEQESLAPKKRGRKAKPPVDPEMKRLRREVARLQVKLQRAEKVIEVQKKISEILGVGQNLPDELKDEES